MFKCRAECGACCVVPSISSSIPGMPDGKPANIRCVHLAPDLKCDIFEHPDRPKVCAGFKAELAVCGINQSDAIRNLSWLEGIPNDKVVSINFLKEE